MSKYLLLLLFPLALLGCQEKPAQKSSSQTIIIESYLQGKAASSLDINCDARCQDALSGVDLQPVPPTKPCTRIYGGPEKIVLRGDLLGEQKESAFSRQGGCEIARFDSLRPFLKSQDISYAELFPDPKA